MSTQPDIAPLRRRFTVAEYEQMGRTGVLGNDDRVELLDGEIVVMSPIGPLHAGSVDDLTHIFVTRLSGRAVVRVQNPLVLGPRSEPEPDFVLARRQAHSYKGSHPGPADVFLVVEVSDTSLPTDRGIKVPLYAEAGIVEVWVLDIDADAIHVHRQPDGSGYDDTRTLRRGDKIAPLAFPDEIFAVADLLGR